MAAWRKLWRRIRRHRAGADRSIDLLSLDEMPLDDASTDAAPEPMELLAEDGTQDGPEAELRVIVQRLAARRAAGQRPDLNDFARALALGEMLVAVGRPDAVEQSFLKIVHSSPEQGAIALRLADLYLEQRRVAQALPLLEAVAEDPTLALGAHERLGDLSYRDADYSRALVHYEEVLARDFEYGRAKSRADQLRRDLDRRNRDAAPTLIGGAEAGASDRYILQRELGRGGGGTVYLATDRVLGRPLALKVLHAHIARDAGARGRLFCEAQIAASLGHPRIVTIYDIDETRGLLALEYCSGGTLADRIALGALPPARALGLLGVMATLLTRVHQAGIVHRDLKPSNWLFRGGPSPDDEDRLVLSDFGIAAAAVPNAADLDAGSKLYRAPEQGSAAAPDPRLDIYAMGVVAIELLLGRPPPSAAETLTGGALEDNTSLWEELEALVPRGPRAGLIALLRQAVAADPTRRLNSAQVLAARAGDLALHCTGLAATEPIARRLRQRTDALDRAAGPWIERLVEACGESLIPLHSADEPQHR